MRRRFPLLLKKRGRRLSDAPAWARAGEALYYAMFVAAGAIGLWWSLSDVLLPEWRLAAEASSFTRTTCTVVGQRVAERPGLAEAEFCPELLVEYAPDGGESIRVWTRHGVGRDMPSRDEAAAALARYEMGDERRCWYDPADPQTVLLSVRRRWWPWLVLSIPISLMVIGVLGLVRTLVSSQVSPERRSARVATGLALSDLDVGSPRPTVASGLPTVERIDDSPGVRQSYRLPADGAEGWRVAGMATLCLVWNVLVALFAYQIGVGYLSSGIRLLVAIVIASPLAVIGWFMTRATWRDARETGSGGVTRVEIDRHPLTSGESATATVMQFGPVRLRSLTVWLVCEEIATYRQGTDTRTATVEVVRRQLLNERRVEVAADEPLQFDLQVRTPTAGPHSFISANNEVRWLLEVEAVPVGRESAAQRFPLCVHPPKLDRSDEFLASTAVEVTA
ncbi:MAG: DUF3592 domain-containing protein [Planctomycetota bacterium]